MPFVILFRSLNWKISSKIKKLFWTHFSHFFFNFELNSRWGGIVERSRNKGLVGLWAGDLVSTISFLTVWPYELPEVISFLGCKICKMRDWNEWDNTPPPPLKKYLEFNIIVIMYHNLPKYWNSLIWVIYKSLLKLHIKSILGLCLGETLPIKIWNAKYCENYLELVLTKNSNHSWIIWKFYFFLIA